MIHLRVRSTERGADRTTKKCIPCIMHPMVHSSMSSLHSILLSMISNTTRTTTNRLTMACSSSSCNSSTMALQRTVLMMLLLTRSTMQFDPTIIRPDRFRFTCPADVASIRQFEPSLVPDIAEKEDGEIRSGDSNNHHHHIWIAVYRSQNNQPSVLVRDEFFRAMNAATTGASTTSPVSSTTKVDPAINNALTVNPPPESIAAPQPVAVARLRLVDRNEKKKKKSSVVDDDDDDDNDIHYVLDSMRCTLIKENMDAECDGGSEHTEAIATAIDGLVLYYLDNIMTTTTSKQQEQQQETRFGFEGSIRAKATLFSAPILEARGFVPVTELNQDMLTHTSSLDDCLEKYAARSISKNLILSPAIRQRAVDIVARLGYIDRNADLQRAKEILERRRRNNNNPDDDNYNPWANSFIH